MAENKDKNTGFFAKLHHKYNLVLRTSDTYEEKLSINLSRFNVFVLLAAIVIVLVFLTTYLIAFTPLKEYIPGYADFNTRKVLRELDMKADSLQRELRSKDLYIHNIRNIIEGRETVDYIPDSLVQNGSLQIPEITRSPEDSILRAQIEKQEEFKVVEEIQEPFSETESTMVSQFLFFPPLQGIITSNYEPATRHYGVDIVADSGEPVKATLDGTVIFSNWTLSTGYTIGIQHEGNLVSVYKHNNSLLKEEGNYVKAGEVIAIIGNTGSLSTGTHLHFELWFNGNPVNPLDYIVF